MTKIGPFFTKSSGSKMKIVKKCQKIKTSFTFQFKYLQIFHQFGQKLWPAVHIDLGDTRSRYAL